MWLAFQPVKVCSHNVKIKFPQKQPVNIRVFFPRFGTTTVKSFYEVNGIWSLDSEFRQALTSKVHMESGAYEITLDTYTE